METNPLVTIIIPCFNYGRFLHDALESVTHQTYNNWECLIIDDGSTDNTKEVASTFLKDTRFKYVHQKNGGLSAARNTGLKNSSGSFIQLLDADDMLQTNKLKLQVEFLLSNPNIDLIYSNVLLFVSDNKNNTTPFILEVKPKSGSGKKLLDELIIDNFFLPGCPLFKRDVYVEVGLFKENLRALEDWHFWFRAALLNFGFFHDDRPGTCLLSRAHGNNMSAERRRMWIAKVMARKDILEIIDVWRKEKKIDFNNTTLTAIIKKNKMLLSRDQARYNLFYGNLFKGLSNIFSHAYLTGKPYFAFYDGLYWLKERIKVSVKD